MNKETQTSKAALTAALIKKIISARLTKAELAQVERKAVELIARRTASQTTY